ncbi:MAG TPA: type II secretion system F family protein [Gaiellaceae bacterium]|nr:type II secretion system F family protein [Gaiellaceae bacterium]
MSLLVPAAVGALVTLAVLVARASSGAAWALARIEPHVRTSAAAPEAQEAPLLERLLVRELEAAGSRLTAGRLALLTAAAAAATALLLHRLPAPVLLLAALVGAAVPHAVLRVRAARRAREFERLLPDLLDMLAASLRVGHGLEQALRGVADEGEEPAASEFRRALGEIRLGRSTAEALDDVARRVGSDDLPFVLTAIEIQQQVGGSLAGLLATVADTVRGRQQFRRRVRALTAMGRASAGVLVAMPFVAALTLSLIHPGYMQPLWTTHTGRLLVGGAIVSLAFGTLLLRRIVEVKV